MPTFRYQSLASNGQTGASGGAALLIDAPDRPTAIRTLREQGITPSLIEAVADGAAAFDAGLTTPHRSSHTEAQTAGPRRGGMSRAEMSSFIRELATAVQAGLPLVQALKTIARSAHSARQQAMLAHLIDRVEHGKSLGEAAASWGKPFSELTVNLIRAGEVSGRLGEVLTQSADLLDRDLKLRRSLMAGLLYPAILAGLITIAIVVIVTVIVPRILGPLAGQIKQSQLPLPTRIVTAVADFVSADWWIILGVLAGVVLLIHNLYHQPASRLSIDRAFLRVPLLGRVLRDVAVARFTRVLGTLISSGLPALPALRITKATLGNKAMERVIEEVCDQVSSGKTISEPMERSGYFPPLLTQIVSLGERSGRLPQMLDRAAGVFEDRTENSIKIFTTAFPPILVVIAAAVVAFVVAAILLPLIQLQELIG